MKQINYHDTISALMRALSAMLQPTADAMRSGGITNLSMSDGKFVIQLENGHVFDGTVHPGQRAGDPVPFEPNTTIEARRDAVASDECSPMTNNQKPTEL